MLDVPPHLFQPLSVDTNISYDLDMSKFPGLDDPQQMYQPALLIATDWSDYVYCDEGTETDSISASSSLLEDDLFALIESFDLPEMDTTNVIDDDTFQSIIDGVIADTVTPCDVLDILDTPDNMPSSDLDSVDTSDVVDTSYHTTDEDLSPTDRVRGQKRRRSSDSEYTYTKKSKSVDNTLRLPALVSVCPTSSHCARHRDS